MRSKQAVGVVGVLAISLGLPVVARAGGDDAAGKAQILACQACHVSDAAARDAPPHLAGQRASYLAKQLKAFKAGDRKNWVMSAITGELSEPDIDRLAAYWSTQTPGSDTTVSPEIAAIKKSKMAFPREFPKGFVYYGSTNKEAQRVVSMAYVNTVGFQAAKAGKPLPDGSVIILVDYAPKLGADDKPLVDQDGTWMTDKIKYYEGMEARAGWGKDIPELLRNVNWSYGMFSPDQAPFPDLNQAICLSCHKPAAKTGFVFGLKKIQAKAGAK